MTFGTSGGYSNIQLLLQTFAVGNNQIFYTCPANTIAYLRPIIGSSNAGGGLSNLHIGIKYQAFDSAFGYTNICYYCTTYLNNFAATPFDSTKFEPGLVPPGSPDPTTLASLGKIKTQTKYGSSTTITSDYFIQLFPDERLLIDVGILSGTGSAFISTQILEQTVS